MLLIFLLAGCKKVKNDKEKKDIAGKSVKKITVGVNSSELQGFLINSVKIENTAWSSRV